MKNLDQIIKCKRIRIKELGNDGGIAEICVPTWKGTVIWSFSFGWEHVSVRPYQKDITPSWEDMCSVKNIFFEKNEVAVQYHPAEEVYINNAENCLHMWRPIKDELPMPPSIMIGVRDA